MSVTIRLNTTVLDRMIAKVPGNVDRVVEEAAFTVEGYAKKNIREWPLIDTGALLNSITKERIKPGLWEVGDFGGYTKKRKSRYGWHDISAGMEYAVYWELGHHNLFTRHYMRMPFLGPALAQTATRFADMLAKGLFK
jgi:hypothetical protein